MRPFALCALVALGCSHAAPAPLEPPLSPQRATHLLSRTSFGATLRDREALERKGVKAYLDEQLHPESIDDSLLEARLQDFAILHGGTAPLVQQLVAQRQMNKRQGMLKEAPPPPEGETGEEPPAQQMVGPRDLIDQLAQVKLIRAVESRRQLEEVMVDFWFNHFNVFAGKEDEAALIPEYENRVLRPNALGSFPELLEATARSPAMLVYLDNWRSAARGPKKPGLNENYARELLELHTLGVEGGYTQADVVEVARCFTGWTLDEPRKDPRFVFRPAMHDFGEKRVLGHVIAAGGGESDALQVLHILETHPSTARFIARKLARKFVSDDPPQALVERVAATYTRTRGDIRAMLRAIFDSPEFWSDAAIRAKARSPLELVAGSLRALDAKIEHPEAAARLLGRLGEPLYAAQPPTGYPDLAQTWLSPGAVLARIDFGLQLARGQLAGVTVDLAALQGASPQDVLSRAQERLGEVSERTRGHVLAQLRAAPPQAMAARAVALLIGAPETQWK